ncbi:hypothetical protein L596_009009 [Steinernema carpocapsae]|uniref:EGF-like domain-containing protein n=1 Tax=Steinernema carpocapsae TaxID=34508 RepID=A0A4U5PE43_STECR|nr:hypothetical protein L596_009009 [Steinernema carpocapsae]
MIKSFALLALFGTLSLAAKLPADPNAECKKRPDGVEFFSNACTRKNVCKNGKLTSAAHDCGKNTCCKGTDENMSCQCRPGYQWEANKKDCSVDSTICKKMPPNEAWLFDDCKMTSVCMDGVRYVEEYQCPKYSHCGLNADKEMACVCKPGFVLDQETLECEDPKECLNRPDNTWFFDSDCTRKKICRGGKLFSDVHRLGNNAVCVKDAKGKEDYVCRAGHTWADSKKKDCVSDNSVCKTAPRGQSFLSDKCTQVNVCLEGELFTDDFQCNPNMHCGFEDGWMRCVCDEGFTKDENNMSQCVKGAPVACLDNELKLTMTPGYAYFTNQCTVQRMCRKGQVTKKAFSCKKNEVCRSHANSPTQFCSCEGKFEYDDDRNCVRK